MFRKEKSWKRGRPPKQEKKFATDRARRPVNANEDNLATLLESGMTNEAHLPLNITFGDFVISKLIYDLGTSVRGKRLKNNLDNVISMKSSFWRK